jgi:hypothetical protein
MNAFLDVPTTNGTSKGVNGVCSTDADAPASNGHGDNTPCQSSLAAMDSTPSRATSNFGYSHQRSNSMEDDDEARPPPAKRARKYSDADQAPIANVSTSVIVRLDWCANSVCLLSCPPSANPALYKPMVIPLSPVQPQHHLHLRVPIDQLSPLCNTISVCPQYAHSRSSRMLAHPCVPSIPFLSIFPHYPSIIKNPIDLGIVEHELMSSNPPKPDPNPNNPHCYSAEEFISDVRLVFSNCITFNGPDHMIAQVEKHVESVFDRQIKQFPPPTEVCPFSQHAECTTH